MKKSGSHSTRALCPNEPIFTLPPYKVEQVFTTMAETIDWGIEIVGVPNLWRQTKGENVKVAVLDTGIAFEHPDLKDAILDAKDFTNSRSGPSDLQGHGSHCAGTIAARENSSGVIGAAPLCKLLVGKVLGDNGSGSSNAVASGIRWAVDKGADVISMSLGSSVSSPQIHEAVKDAVAAGVFIIAAAGNEGPSLDTVGYPGAYPETVAVGAISQNRKIASFSSRGNMVDIVAPGDKILSTYPPRGLATLSGTSMATPLVAGVVALMLSKHKSFGGVSPIKTQKDLMEHLRRTAIDLGPSGYDPSYGAGLINPEQLLMMNGIGDSLVALLLEQSDLTDAGKKKLNKFLVEYGITDSKDIRIGIKSN